MDITLQNALRSAEAMSMREQQSPIDRFEKVPTFFEDRNHEECVILNHEKSSCHFIKED